MTTSRSHSDHPRSPVIVTESSSPCHRCSGDLYLTATVPDATLPRKRIYVLCPSCDADDPSAQGLLAFMALYGLVDETTLGQFEELVSEWLAAPRTHGVDEQTLDRDIEDWLRDRDR